MAFKKQFGGKLTSKQKERYGQSKNWQTDKFMNLEETTMDLSFRTVPSLLKKQFTNRKERSPLVNLSVKPLDLTSFLSPSEKIKGTWYGHSVLLLRIQGKNILIDPMFGSNAAPIAPFAVKRFSENTLQIIDNLPAIDLVLLSHDHYDHLDFESIMKLKSKTKTFYVALGTARHLISWGFNSMDIREFDWWDRAEFEGLDISFTPTRHFSGRGLTDRAKSLWGGWVIRTEDQQIYFSGDSGYGSHFKEVGQQFGSFDLGFMECGQYNEHWHQIHMYPEESVKAALDAGVKLALPVHWGAFALALHPWKDPIDRFTKEAVRQNLSILTPELGEIFGLGKEYLMNHWWEKLD